MPFLIPAVSAAICDLAILFISRNDPLIETTEGEDGENYSRVIYQGGYIFPFAAFRLSLLVIPLPYHSYHGTALRFPKLYQFFYIGTLSILLIHMLGLSMIDPGSLSCLMPTQTEPNFHDAYTRHLWLLLVFSLASVSCHVLLFLHVRSTAPSSADLLQGRPKVLFYYVKERGDNERDSLLGGTTPTTSMKRRDSANNRMQQISNQIVLEMQTRLQQAKEEWTKRLDDYRIRSSSHNNHNGNGTPNGGGTSGQDLLHRPPTPFRVMLQLFAYEDVLTNGRLNAVYELDNGASIMFFIPQLLSFLLHSAYESSPLLEAWILETCRRNVYFAHRCYWFLRAWSLETNSTVDGLGTRLSKSSSLASFDEQSTSADLPSQPGKFLPEERVVIEQLLRRVMECGEEPARYLYFGGEKAPEMINNSSSTAINKAITTTSPSALMMAVESGKIPVDPITKTPSAKHWDCVAASRRFGFLPLDQALTTQQQTSSLNPANQTSYFDTTPVFMDALLTIADNLFKFPKELRPSEFQRQLQLLEVQALPSNAVYIPIQDVHHRVWRIVAEESIAISTKERVPCIIALEVVEYEKDETATSRDVRRLLERVTPGETPIILPDLLHTDTERDLINRWRFGYREPHRRDTALEKIAYQMRHGMSKIPIDQMKTSVQAQLEKFKDTKHNLQDFWTIHVPDTFEDEEVILPSALGTMEAAEATDIERGLPEPEQPPASTPSKPPTGPPLPSVSRLPITPRKKDSSNMGQWSSPHKKHVDDLDVDDIPMEDLFVPPRKNVSSYQRMETFDSTDTERGSVSNNSGRLNGCLPGRKKDENGEHRNSTGGKPPTKPPPVVFKENWKEKTERIRSGSAFGSHPGWRLLPILVKANDDLRQEQLASQLIYRISLILARERVPVWLYPYEILAITESGGIIEAIPDTISIASLKKNDPSFTSLKGFFQSFFTDADDLSDAKANFCESLAGYSMVCFLLQIKDRHNGNILLDNRGHVIHIDFGFFFLSSPGKNTGFESAPFKLTREFVEVLDGPDSRLFKIFRMLCYRSFIALRRHCMEIILLVEMLKKGNEDLACFRGRPDDAINELRHRFRLDLNDRACLEYVNALIDESLENWRTNWYDRYQRYCVGVL